MAVLPFNAHIFILVLHLPGFHGLENKYGPLLIAFTAPISSEAGERDSDRLHE